MLKELARDIIPLVNDVDKYDMLHNYVKYRINLLRDQLELPNTDVNSLRGAISELRLFLRLREDVIRDSK